ncbi:alpha-amylase family glycosyl hydrolase [Microbulbifer thermotolerans]|uniref:Alpha-amylase n=1 Tax=Microbulbifer thermotolerans TaxID=252514 RepID=A0A143HPY4_MICTH|nr:alpha-amylase family glycosyl hydrolase [Microbulbifer thermotolerans]AMX03480.1 alpha-amlyase [Microbulbifer thermotolerans]MCX2795372.1 alpha-amylase family glycosyl hydrolase [Microbulbifer thermotolerans]
MRKFASLCAALLLCSSACAERDADAVADTNADAFWRNATVYFLLPDRFANGDPENDLSYGRGNDAAPLRGFHGGDLQGVIDKLNQGYFNALGVDALWMSPVYEQIHGATDEGTGRTYAFHGYWPKDWTSVDRNFGSEAKLAELIETAHRHGIRVLLDVIVNHTGPVTDKDPLWPESWVRAEPVCDWSGFSGTVSCTLVKNLPDIRTEDEKPVALPPQLVDKWKAEGRLEQEQAELEAFFQRTGYPRAPKYYLVKWITDWVREYGVDGFRVDTVKHVEPEVWQVLKREASLALADWKKRNPDKKLDDRDFYMIGEVYGYGITGGREYDFGDRKVDFFDYGFDSLINFDMTARAAKEDMESIFSSYSKMLHGGALGGLNVLNYLTSHDDAHSFDRERQRPREAALKLLLAPGAAQIYYGDEVARPLMASDAEGDAQLRTPMNWSDLEKTEKREVLDHWRKLGQFRQAHPAVGAGVHRKLQDKPYTFARTLEGEASVLVSIGTGTGKKSLPVYGLFAEGTRVKDFYSGLEAVVKNGRVAFDTEFDLLLLGQAANSH